MSKTNSVNLVVAHKLEALPLIGSFGLSLLYRGPGAPIYGNNSGVMLIVSGMGVRAAESAVLQLHEYGSADSDGVAGWLNVGIAGHQSAAIGQGVLAHKVSERSSGQSFYPAYAIAGFSTTNVITVDEPELAYPMDAAYEMEAAGFCRGVSSLVSAELMLSFKIVSDNPGSSVDNIDKAFIADCMTARLDDIHLLVEHLSATALEFNSIYMPPREFGLLCEKHRLTQTQTIQLRHLCLRYRALGRSEDLGEFLAKAFASSRELILEMRTRLSNREPV